MGSWDPAIAIAMVGAAFGVVVGMTGMGRAPRRWAGSPASGGEGQRLREVRVFLLEGEPALASLAMTLRAYRHRRSRARRRAARNGDGPPLTSAIVCRSATVHHGEPAFVADVWYRKTVRSHRAAVAAQITGS